MEFMGWQSKGSVQEFINRIKNRLNDDEWKQRIDMLIPPKAIDMLYEKLTGRFRPIVSK